MGMAQRKGEKERAELGWGERGEGRPRAEVGRAAWAGLLGRLPGFGFFYFFSLFYFLFQTKLNLFEFKFEFEFKPHSIK